MKNQFLKPGLLILGALFLFASFIYLKNEEPATPPNPAETSDLQPLLQSHSSPARDMSMGSNPEGQEGDEEEVPNCALVCEQLTLYYAIFCGSPTRPSLCLCDGVNNPPVVPTNIVFCPGVRDLEHIPTGARNQAPEEVDIAKLIDKPIAVFSKPYEGSLGCTVTAGKHPLVLDPVRQQVKKEEAPAHRGAGTDNKAKSQASAVKLCKKGCGNAVQWAFEPVDEKDLLQGHYIRLAGKKGQYLSYNEDNGVTLASKNDKMTTQEQKEITWHVGAGQINKEEAVTGYRIVSSLDFTKGLAVDKKTGAVTVVPIFNVITEGEELKGIQLAPEYESVWTFSNCKSTEKDPKE